MKNFEANGYHCTHDSKRPQGEIAVINTCGFIGLFAGFHAASGQGPERAECAVIIEQGKLLMTRWVPEDRALSPLWSLPGGGRPHRG